MIETIDSMPDEKWAILKEYRTKYRALATSTETANKELAEEGAAKAYKMIEEPMPPVVWTSSPFVGMLMAALVEQDPDGELRKIFGPYEKFTKEIYDAASEEDQRKLRTASRPMLERAAHGQQDLYWLAHWDFVLKHLPVTYDGPSIEGHLQVAENAGWWWMLSDVCIMSDRPCVILADENDNGHAEHGPYWAYRDDFKMYAWHGQRIPAEWIEDKENIDPSLALTHPNIEQRRCLAEILGWHTVIEQLNPKIIDKDPDPQIGTLVEVDLPDHGPCKFLRVLEESTGREFALYAAHEANTALEAQALAHQIDVDLIKGGFVRT